nr:D-hexose-6-phosphate mutarotase [Propionicimonas sp.]
MPEDLFPGVEAHHRGAHYAVLDAGAHVLAWTPPGQNPVLWLSPLASFEPGVAVRGGVPVVFPWFGAGESGDRSPSHGFARTAAWQREEVVNELAASGPLLVRHRLDATGRDSAPFVAELTSRFTPERLEVTLTVTNPGAEPFRYEEALHTYVAVSDVAEVAVDGLDGCGYLDKVDGGPEEVVQAGAVRFAGEVDRVYRHDGDAVITDPGWGRQVVVGKSGSANTVIWNPGAAKGAALADVGPNWPGFVCVEAGNVRDAAIELAPGDQHSLAQVLRLS